MVDFFVPSFELTPPPIVIEVIVEVSADYTQQIVDDVIIGTGILDITLISLSDAVKPISIRAKSSTRLALIPDGSDEIEPSASPVTSNSAITLIPGDGIWLQS